MKWFQALKLSVCERLEDRLTRWLVRLQNRSQRGEALAEECPSLETLAAYVDHCLSEKEKAQLESHMIRCERCRKIVVMVFRSKQAVPDPDPLEPENQ